ncbi:BTAD domain-containing putative transcriptional regulator [Kitasatospora sp. CM 4170]|uniref:BTAD domain-containing putative transcriptional regulator n=1 Tax=Kitasatospora aburaviensis TaxID=67265 RepID=A0ABW1EW12_9ACTN|nr:BTAD domain-containing putative transcriptional regulator [Kitasatospora sp. CM 4170]WNM50000.1 BTAD domain-containing putative transcriptional regulator [Kitasatospora sp. CM 4170]
MSDGGRPLPGTAPRHRAVLGYLLLHAGTVLSTARLIDAVWGPTPPGTARAQVHAAVTAIRRVLRGTGTAEVLQTRPSGYVIVPRPGQLDSTEFDAAVAAASEEDPEKAAVLLREALTMWRGQPFADVNADYVADARARLLERRLAAVERLMELELSLGRHREVLDDLSAEAAAHPLRERLCHHLMLALHRAGRQADALAAGRLFRRRLAEDQGLDPGRAFAVLEQSILHDDPGLHLAPSPPPPAPATAGRANFLPFDIPDFAGRDEELDRLGAASGVVTLAAIDGMAGIGKTALAVRAAHRLAGAYPDGQLFVDLHAHTAGQAPLEPGAALEVLLLQLGLPAEAIPSGLVARSALWRSELAGRRVVAVLDNAGSADHVRPLLPGATESLVLITSRRRLSDLDGIRTLTVDLLPAGDAVELFTRIIGERAHAEPLAVLDVLQLCGFLPLAVRIAAARLHNRPRWTVQYLAGRLRDQKRRLTELSTADRRLAAAFALSHQHLDEDQQRMFRLLGLHPGHDVDPYAAAALADTPLDRAEGLLEDLLDAHMLQQHEPGRYTLHGLLREHALATATATESEQARHDALTRLFDYYRYTARTAVDRIHPCGADRRPVVPRPDTPLVDLADPAAATVWLETERANLIASESHTTEHGWPVHAGHLASILRPYLGLAHHADAPAVPAQALRAGRSRGDRARGHLETALTPCCDSGDRIGEAHAPDDLAGVYERQGLLDAAHRHLTDELALHRLRGNRSGEASVLDRLGGMHRRTGCHEEARAYCRQAEDLYHDLGRAGDRAGALDGLGDVARAAGEPARAVTEQRAALGPARDHGDLPEQARAHDG